MLQAAAPPSIAGRLARALMGWALVWGLAVGLAVWLAASYEVDELLDEALRDSAELMTALVAQTPDAADAADAARGIGAVPAKHFAWQLVAADGRVLLRSVRAPQAAWHTAPRAGFADVPGWRIYGQAAGHDGRFLYAAQTRDERAEARSEVALGAVLSALAVGLLGQLWLRARVRHELEPLQQLSQRLAQWRLDDGPPSAALGVPARQELAPVHEAIEGLAVRLASRLAHEQAFSAHAAHALRTPLAGIDAQLAVAARSAPPELAERLVRVRGAAARLQHVVAALLGLFRSVDGTASLQRGPVQLAALVARLPAFALEVQVQGEDSLDADADLLSAALLNLLDNAQRHGARHVILSLTAAGHGLQMVDDGPGVTAARREQLAQALAEERYADTGGLGLMLADRVARAHGGRVTLPAVAQGFAVAMNLGPPGAA
ncbi:MAG: sensor histidine kinase [Rubrivivax sp.]|nr:sensor histidine kinase [Rubrivivax sp.]